MSTFSQAWAQLTGYVTEARDDGDGLDPAQLLSYMTELRGEVLATALTEAFPAARVGGQAEPSDAEPLGIDQLAGILELLSDGDFDRVGVLSNDDARALIREVMRLRQLSFAELVDVAVGRSPAAASGEQR